MRAELLRLVTAGSVDDGKSTLIGRLLYDSRQVPDDQLAAVQRTSRERGDVQVNLALLTDGLRAEREQGITIDVAYRYFATARRSFILADCPGHERYTRNMVTGASTADLAIILVDARYGVVEQSRRHAFLASLLGISHVVVCINKMDLVDFDDGVFRRIEQDFSEFAAKLEIKDVAFIPTSALHGDNIVDRSPRMPWYDGPPLLYHLERVHIASDRNLIDCRFPVQWVVRPTDDIHHDYRGYAGQVASGIFRTGDDVVVLPTMARTRIARIETLDGPVTEAFPPMSVIMLLEDDIDISRGDMLCRPNNVPHVSQELEATVCWMGDAPLVLGKPYLLKQTTRHTRARVDAVRYKLDVRTLSREPASSLAMNEIGRVSLRTTTALFYDEYKRNRETGSFILIDDSTHHTVAGGTLLGAAVARDDRARTRAHQVSSDVTPQAGSLSRDARFAALGVRGGVVWLTGLSGSGKSTLAIELERSVVARGRPAYVLDGDNLRHGLCGDLTFSRSDRKENVRRAAHVAGLFADAGLIVIVALISPFAGDRALAREVSQGAKLPFLEVYLSTPLEECERRDPKGLYKRARAGQLEGFTGIDDPYEAPDNADVTIAPGGTTAADAEHVIGALVALGVLP